MYMYELTGDHCQIESTCHGHGTFVNKSCTCDPGYDGLVSFNSQINYICTVQLYVTMYKTDIFFFFVLQDCSIKVQCPQDCNGHGKCRLPVLLTTSEDSQTSDSEDMGPVDGICECNVNFKGHTCETRKCLNDCSGNGVCPDDTGICECYSGLVRNSDFSCSFLTPSTILYSPL